MRTVLTFDGNVSIGGAGIQVDIKTMIMIEMYAMNSITALIEQKTTGIFGILEESPESLGKQIDAIFSDISSDPVKIGMIQSREFGSSGWKNKKICTAKYSHWPCYGM